MAKLTDRQQRIKDLFQEGKNAREIAKILKITPNGVYQQRRRIRDIEGGGSRSRTPGRQSSRRGGTGSSALRPPAPTPRPTPLQAIRHRRDEIRAQVKVAADNLADAERELKGAQEAHDKLQARHAEELKQLDKAESALTGKPVVRPARSRSRSAARSNGSKDGAKARTGAQASPQGARSPNGDGETAGGAEGAETSAGASA